MIIGMYTSVLALLSASQARDGAAISVLNMQQPGYKADRPGELPFRSAFDLAMGARAVGPGMGIEQVRISMNQGPMEYTGRPLDLALVGPGFFQLQDQDKVFYTRNGAFYTNEEGNLVGENNSLLLGEHGPINIAHADVVVDRSGVVWAGETQVDRLALVNFADSRVLQRFGGHFNAPAGAASPAKDVYVDQGALEAVNVQLIDQMQEISRAQAAYSFNAKALALQEQSLDQAFNRVMR